MFYKNKSLAFFTQMTLVLFVYSENLQPYTVLYSDRNVLVFQLFPGKQSPCAKTNYTLNCPGTLKCTLSIQSPFFNITNTFSYEFISSTFKNTTGAYLFFNGIVDFNNKIYLTDAISSSAQYTNGYYYNSKSDSLTVWLQDYLPIKVFYHGLVSETVGSHQHPIAIRFSTCNQIYNLKILDEFGKNIFKTNQKEVYVRKEFTNPNPSSSCLLSVLILPEDKEVTNLQIPPVLKDDKKKESSTPVNKTVAVVNPEHRPTDEAKTKLLTSTTALTTLKTTTTGSTTITTTTEKITASGTNTSIPNQDISVLGESTKTLLIILISLVVFLIFIICVLIYFCKKRTASGGTSSTFSKIKSTYTEWLASNRHLRESPPRDPYNEENSYCTPLEDCVEVPKPHYDYVMVRENNLLSEHDYMVVKDRQTNPEDTYLVPKEEEK
ncbi:unnamed protein product [Diabrotica balteata]|uniref:Uncharacterized protein n=1 Tax=Diabrotica balteata TaxID=107213 RepID=A0A9P0GZN4_DIABA|nr:unnamed protein product [Diabrotica balteata]